MEKIILKERLNFSYEKNGFYQLDNCVMSRIVNESGKNIIVDINKGMGLREITEKYCKNGFLKKDLYLFLADLRTLKYIDFEDAFFSDLFECIPVKIAGEKEYIRICEYIQNSEKRVIYPEVFKKESFNVMVVRTKSFSNKETYFYEENENEIGSIIAVNGFTRVNSPLVITLLVVGNKGVDSLTDFYKKVEGFCVKEGKKKIKLLFDKMNITDQVQAFIEKTGFVFEAELKCEDGEKDLIIYSRILNK